MKLKQQNTPTKRYFNTIQSSVNLSEIVTYLRFLDRDRYVNCVTFDQRPYLKRKLSQSASQSSTKAGYLAERYDILRASLYIRC